MGYFFQIKYLLALVSKCAKDFTFSASGISAYRNKSKWSLKRFEGGSSVRLVSTLQLMRFNAGHFHETTEIGRPHSTAPAMDNKLITNLPGCFNQIGQPWAYQPESRFYSF